MSGFGAMTLAQAVFRVLSLMASASGEAESERAARLEQVASEIAGVSMQRSGGDAAEALGIAAELVAVGYHESKFSDWVGQGRCHEKPDWCDGGRARSYYQLWQVSCPALWNHPVGSAAGLRHATACAARHLGLGKVACGKGRSKRSAITGAFARYAKGHGCSWSGAGVRYATYEKVRRELLMHLTLERA